MSTILFFTNDRFAFANLSPSATTEKIILTPDPVDGSRLFIGNSTMISYDARCNISTFDGSRATMTIDTLNNRVGIGISSPTVALDIVDAGGVRIVGPTNITGATTFTGNSRVIGVATANSFTGSGIGLTSIPAARIVGSLPAAVYANATIPVTALSGYDNGSLVLSGQLATESLNASTISTQHGTFSSLTSGAAGIDTLSVRSFSTAFGFVSTLTIGRLLAGSISSGSIGSLVTDSGSFNLITAETAGINVLNTALLSTGAGIASSFTVGILYAATISSGTLVSLSSALVSVSNAGVTNATNITTVSNAGVTNATNITTVSNSGVTNATNITTVSNSGVTNATNITTVSNNLTTVSNSGTTNATNITTVSNAGVTNATNITTVSNAGVTNATNIITVSNTTNYLLTVSNISAMTISTTYGFFSTISAGTLFGKFIGDGSLLTNLPIATAFTTVSTNLTTVSNAGATNTANITTISNNLTTVSNTGATNTANITTVSTNLTTVSNAGATNTANITTISNNLTTVSNAGATNTANITTISNNLTTVSNAGATNTANITTVSNNLTTVSNTGATNTANITIVSTNLTTVSNAGATNSANITTVSNNLTTVSNAGATNSANITTVSNNLTTVSNTVNYLLAVSNISAITTSTSYGFFSTISAGIIFGRFVGDGSGLTGIASGGVSIIPPILSTTLLSTGILTARNISTTVISTSYGFFSTISSGTIFGRFVGDGSGLTGIASGGLSIIPPVLSTTFLSTGFLSASNISVTTMSTSFGFFSTISAGTVFGRFVGDGSLLTNLPVTSALTTVSNNLTTVSNTGATVSNTVNYLLAVSNISAVTMSTSFGFFSSISAGTIFGRHIGDGSLLTNLPVTTALTTVSNTVNYLLAVSNISAVTMSTTFGFFSTISAGTIFGRFVGDGSGLTGIPSGGVSIIPPVLSTTLLSTGILTARNISTTIISTNAGFASSFFINRLTTSTASALLGSFSSISVGQAYISSLTVDSLFIGNDIGFTNMGDVIATSLSTILVTTANLIAVNVSASFISTNYGFFSTISAGTLFGRHIGDGSLLTNLPVTAGLTTVSNTVNYLLAVSNISATTMSTSFGFFSTISAGTLFGRHVGDGSLLTNLPVTAALTTVSNTVNYLLAVSNISAATMSTSFGFFSTISAGTLFGRHVGDGSLLTNLPVTAALTTVSNTGVSNSTNINTVSNTVNYLLAVSNISAATMSTSFGFFSTISAGTLFGRHIGDGSLLTNLPVTAALTSVSNTGVSNSTNINTVSNTVNYLLAVSNISAATMSTSFGFFSTISAGTIFGRHVGDGSLLTNLPVTAALTTVSNTGVSNSTNINTVSNTVNYLLAVSNISAATMSTSFGFFSTISAGTIFGRFVGDGSMLTGIASGGISIVPPVLSTTLLSTGILTARNISVGIISTNYGFFSTISTGSVYGKFIGDGSALTGLPVGVTNTLSTQALYTSSISSANITSAQGYISSLIVDALTFGLSNSYISMGDLIATSMSTIQTFTSSLLTINLQVGNVSSLSYISFPGLQQGYAQTIIAEQSTGTGTQELLFYKGSTTTDRIRMQTTGSIIFEPGVGARSFPAVGSNVTPAMIINASSNVGIGIAAPTTTLDVAGTGRFQILSTQQLFVSSISSGIVYGRFVGDGSLLTGLPASGLSALPPILSTTLLSTGNLTASNISVGVLSTSYGFFSTISAGTIFGRFVGDGSLLTGLPASGLSALPPILSTTLLSTGNLTASNISVGVLSTTYGFFSTISAGTIFGRFVGDGSLLTGIVGSGGMSFVPPVLSTTLLSTGILTARNISTAVISTNEGFASSFFINRLTTSTVSALLGSFSSLSVSQVYVSSLTVDNLTIGNDNGFINMGDVIAGSLSTVTVVAESISTNNGFISSISARTINTDILNTRLFSTASGSASTFTIGTLFAGTISSASIGSVLTAAGAFSSISAGTANLDILNARLFSTAAGTASSFTIGSIFASSGSISSLRGNEARISTVTANTLSSYIVYASSVNTPNIYVTNIYANDGGIANVVASSLNASRAVFVQVIASSFQGSLIGKNLLVVETY
jgi:hypothetical protein